MAGTVGHVPWPWEKLREAIATSEHDGRCRAVVVAEGDCNPTHCGHVQMLQQARLRLERAGYLVLAGWLCPGSSCQAAPKAGDVQLSTNLRLRLAELAVAEDRFVSVAAWPADERKLGSFEVVCSLQAALERDFAADPAMKGVRVFYVLGDDKTTGVRRLRPELQQGIVIVPRGGEDTHLERPNQLLFVADRPEKQIARLSSSAVRRAVLGGDTAYLAKALTADAVSLLLSPTDGEHSEFLDDFHRLVAATAPPGPWPCEKFLKRLPTMPEDKTLAVLVASGSMNPLHNGHVLMLHQAKERLQEAGYAVAAAWLVPDETPVGTPALSTAFRRRVAELSVCNDELVSVSSWAPKSRMSAAAVREVSRELRSYLTERLPGSLEDVRLRVFYACGSDRAKQQGFTQGLMSTELEVGFVIVPRDPEELLLDLPQKLVFVADPPPGEAARWNSQQLLSYIMDGRAASAAQIMARAASRFVMSPTTAEHLAFQADFEKLGVALPKAPELARARERLKGILQAWIGQHGLMHTSDLAQLLMLLDPSWTTKELDALLAGTTFSDNSRVAADEFIDWIFGCCET